MERKQNKDYNIVYRNKPNKPLTVSELFGLNKPQQKQEEKQEEKPEEKQEVKEEKKEIQTIEKETKNVVEKPEVVESPKVEKTTSINNEQQSPQKDKHEKYHNKRVSGYYYIVKLIITHKKITAWVSQF